MKRFSFFGSRRARKVAKRRRSKSALSVGAEILEVRQMLSGTIPQLASSPGAPVTIYLDFDGHYEAQWGSENPQPATTPVFDLDNNPNDFSIQEQEIITDVYKRVAEDFSVFTVNVTTIAPPSIGNSNAEAPNVLRVAIGGSAADWYSDPNAGGVAVTKSFYLADYVNTAYVFTDNLLPTAANIGHLVSHEAGHAFGLQHQSEWSTLFYNGQSYEIMTDEYYEGDGVLSPLMGGFDPNAERDVWWIGRGPDDPNLYQNDGLVMWGNGDLNGGSFDFRPDDHPDQISSQPIIPHTGPLTVDGIISPYALHNGGADGPHVSTHDSDKDYVAVSLGGSAGLGKWDVAVDVADVGPNLDARIEVYDFSGNFLYAADPGNSLDAKLSLNPGNYWIAVMGHNHPEAQNQGGDSRYSDMGTYTLTVDFSFFDPNYEFIAPKELFIFMEDPYRLFDVIEEIAGRMEMDTEQAAKLISSIDTRLLVDYTYEALSSDAIKTSLQEFKETDSSSSDAESDGKLTMTDELSAAINAAFTRGLEELLSGDLKQTTETK
jgi:hypothetical protein